MAFVVTGVAAVAAAQWLGSALLAGDEDESNCTANHDAVALLRASQARKALLTTSKSAHSHARFQHLQGTWHADTLPDLPANIRRRNAMQRLGQALRRIFAKRPDTAPQDGSEHSTGVCGPEEELDVTVQRWRQRTESTKELLLIQADTQGCCDVAASGLPSPTSPQMVATQTMVKGEQESSLALPAHVSPATPELQTQHFRQRDASPSSELPGGSHHRSPSLAQATLLEGCTAVNSALLAASSELRHGMHRPEGVLEDVPMSSCRGAGAGEEAPGYALAVRDASTGGTRSSSISEGSQASNRNECASPGCPIPGLSLGHLDIYMRCSSAHVDALSRRASSSNLSVEDSPARTAKGRNSPEQDVCSQREPGTDASFHGGECGGLPGKVLRAGAGWPSSEVLQFVSRRTQTAMEGSTSPRSSAGEMPVPCSLTLSDIACRGTGEEEDACSPVRASGKAQLHPAGDNAGLAEFLMLEAAVVCADADAPEMHHQLGAAYKGKTSAEHLLGDDSAALAEFLELETMLNCSAMAFSQEATGMSEGNLQYNKVRTAAPGEPCSGRLKTANSAALATETASLPEESPSTPSVRLCLDWQEADNAFSCTLQTSDVVTPSQSSGCPPLQGGGVHHSNVGARNSSTSGTATPRSSFSSCGSYEPANAQHWPALQDCGATQWPLDAGAFHCEASRRLSEPSNSSIKPAQVPSLRLPRGAFSSPSLSSLQYQQQILYHENTSFLAQHESSNCPSPPAVLRPLTIDMPEVSDALVSELLCLQEDLEAVSRNNSLLTHRPMITGGCDLVMPREFEDQPEEHPTRSSATSGSHRDPDAAHQATQWKSARDVSAAMGNLQEAGRQEEHSLTHHILRLQRGITQLHDDLAAGLELRDESQIMAITLELGILRATITAALEAQSVQMQSTHLTHPQSAPISPLITPRDKTTQSHDGDYGDLQDSTYKQDLLNPQSASRPSLDKARRSRLARRRATVRFARQSVPDEVLSSPCYSAHEASKTQTYSTVRSKSTGRLADAAGQHSPRQASRQTTTVGDEDLGQYSTITQHQLQNIAKN